MQLGPTSVFFALACTGIGLIYYFAPDADQEPQRNGGGRPSDWLLGTAFAIGRSGGR